MTGCKTRKQRDTGASGVGSEATDSTGGPNFGLDDSARLARRNVGELMDDTGELVADQPRRRTEDQAMGLKEI